MAAMSIVQVFTLFQSTLPVKGATAKVRVVRTIKLISIHAPREGSDYNAIKYDILGLKFQSTLPVKGATAFQLQRLLERDAFQSTLPVKGATT